MNEMVERVAKAIEMAPDYNEQFMVDRHAAVIARIAIASMRDPTPGMVGRVLGDKTSTIEAVIRKWQAMIDEALK